MEAACRVLLEDPVSPQYMSIRLYLEMFLITCVLEAPVYWQGLRSRIGLSKTLGAILVLNLAIHPAVTWLFPWIFSRTPLLTRDYLLVSETFAILAEAILLITIYKVGHTRAWLVSFCANLFSWWTGLYVAFFLGL